MSLVRKILESIEERIEKPSGGFDLSNAKKPTQDKFPVSLDYLGGRLAEVGFWDSNQVPDDSPLVYHLFRPESVRYQDIDTIPEDEDIVVHAYVDSDTDMVEKVVLMVGESHGLDDISSVDELVTRLKWAEETGIRMTALDPMLGGRVDPDVSPGVHAAVSSDLQQKRRVPTLLGKIQTLAQGVPDYIDVPEVDGPFVVVVNGQAKSYRFDTYSDAVRWIADTVARLPDPEGLVYEIEDETGRVVARYESSEGGE